MPTTEERFWAKVDKTESCWNWKAAIDRYGYGRFHCNGNMLAHRFVYTLFHNEPAENMQVDHICRNRLCVNPDHLRLVTNKQNSENRAVESQVPSGARGVYWYKAGNVWRASLCHNRKIIYLGQFSTVEEATAAVIAKRVELFTHNDADKALVTS